MAAELADLLPPVIQEFVVNASGYIAGIDEMIAANARLAESIAGVTEEMKGLQETAGKADIGAAAGAGAGVDTAAVAEAAAAQTELADTARAATEAEAGLTDAERAAADMAQLEAEMAASLAREETLLADASRSVADMQAKVAVSAKLSADANEVASVKTSAFEIAVKNAVNVLAKLSEGTVLAAGVFAAYGVKSAADYQTQILRLKTSAGETGDLLGGKFTGNLKTVSDGILKLAVDTATSTKELTSGMYMIESAGFHGASGLNVLKAAAEGARAEGADLGTVGNALTTYMKDYHIQASDAIPAMNQMIAVVAQGKLKMQDLAGALHSVLPIAASAHLSFAQIGGAIATMTSHGVSADLATQHLANMIRNLIAPNNVAAQEMANLGLSAVDVSQHVGQRGLTGTLDTLINAIMKHMGPAGLVLINTFNQSREAAQSASTMLAAMPAPLKNLAEAFQHGKLDYGSFAKEIKGLPADQHAMGAAFAASVTKADGFNQALKNNRGAAETVDSALKKMTGGAVGLEGALQLTGQNAGDFKNAVNNVGAAAQHTGKHVENWQQIQKTLNFQLDKLKQGVEVAAIKVGTVLLPVIMKFGGEIAKIGGPLLKGAANTLKEFWAGFTGKGDASKGAAEIGKVIRSIANDLERFGKDAISAFKILMPVLGGVAKVLGAEFLVALKLVGELLANVIGPALVLFAKGLRDVKPLVELLAGIVGVLAIRLAVMKTVQMAVAIATRIWAAAQALLNLVMDANPVILLMIAIGALVAGVIYAYEHFQTFRNIVNDVFSFLKNIVLDVVNFVKDHWQLLVAIIGGPIGVIVYLIIKYWSDIKKWFFDGVNYVVSVVSWFGRLPGIIGGAIVGAANAVFHYGYSLLQWFADLPGRIWGYLKGLYGDMMTIGHNIIVGIWNGLVNMASWLYNQIVGLISDIIPGPIKRILGIGSPSKLMHTYGQAVGQGLAEGIVSKYDTVRHAVVGMAGIVAGTSPGQLGFALAGSTGGMAGAITGTMAASIASATSGPGAGVQNVQVVNVTVQGSVTAERDLQSTIQQAVLQMNVRNPTNQYSLPVGR